MAQGPARSLERTPRPAAEAPAAPRAAFAEVVAALAREIDSGERLMDRASRGTGTGLGAAGLIALQAGIYRYTEAVDLSARLVDRASAAVKTTLGSSG